MRLSTNFYIFRKPFVFIACFAIILAEVLPANGAIRNASISKMSGDYFQPNKKRHLSYSTQPPEDCTSTNIVIQNPENASQSFEAKFCENSELTGVGDLWLHKNSTIAHIIRIRPDVGILNLEPRNLVVYGPDYWYELGSSVRLTPGDYIVINGTRFGVIKNEQIYSMHVNINLIGEIFFMGSTPPPDISIAEALWRWMPTALGSLFDLPDMPEGIGTAIDLISNCRDAIVEGTKLDFFYCLTSIAKAPLEFFKEGQKITKIFGYEIVAQDLKNIFGGIKYFINFPKLFPLIKEASDITQDGIILVYYPDNADPPPPPCIYCNDEATLTSQTPSNGTIVSPGQTLIKTWRMRNTGSTNWDRGYKLVFVGGEQMGAPSEVDVPAASPGQDVDISVNLTAPATEGQHIGYWQLRNPQGTYFGPRIYVLIDVQEQSAFPINLTADPASPANTNSVQFHAQIDNFPNFRAMRLKIDGSVVYEISAPEFDYTWDTSSYEIGEHSVIVEVADQTDTSWLYPEIQAMSYNLEGTSNPNNHVPYAPDLISPHDWYVYYSGNTAQLCAQENGDPDGDSITEYYFDVYDSAELWNSGWIGNNCVTTSALGPYNYKWRVKVRDNFGAESSWSDSWHFTLVNPNLSITEFYFEPQDPDSEQVKIRACTEGQGGIGITMRVSVNDANDGSGNGQWHIIYELGVPCFSEIDAPMWNTLEYGDGTHLVRIEAHGSNTGWDGAAVAEQTYTLPHRRPAGPNLIAPRPLSELYQEAIYLDSRTVTFQWEKRVNVDQYTLYVSDLPEPRDDPDPIFQQTFDASITKYTVTFDQDHPVLYWQVESSNDVGSSASNDQLFGIDRQNPSCTIDTLSTITYENVFQVNWSGTDNLAGVRTFDIQYQDSERGTWEDWLIDIPSNKTYELFTGQPGHRYYFRCRTTDNANNDSNYPTSADTFTIIDPSARPPSPWWNTAYSLKRNLIIQNNDDISLPVLFPVHLHFDDTTVPTAAEIYNASSATIKGDDARIVYEDQQELDRFIQRFTTNQIDIWFPLQTALLSGNTDNTHYQFYYGNASAGSPPTNVNTVFLPKADSNTIGLWHFQDGSGTTVQDTSGYSNHGTFSNGSWVDGWMGWTGNFNGLNSAVTVPHSNVFNVPAITIEVWMYMTRFDDTGEPIVMKRIPYTPGGFELHMTHDREFSWLIDHYGMNSSYALSLNTWHHIAVTSNGVDQLCAYVDGNQIKCAEGGPLEYNNGPITIGFISAGDGDHFFPGYIQHVRISNIARTSFPYAKIDVEASVAAGVAIEPPGVGSPDLAILDLTNYPNPDGGFLVQAVVQNQGDLPTINGFFTDLYADHLPTGEGDYTGSLRFWVNDPIEAGATITMTTALDYTSGSLAQINTVSAASETTFTLYAQTDSAGGIGEPDEANNIYADGLQTCIASPDAYESDDVFEDATPIDESTPQVHNFDSPGDQDWFKLEAQAGETYIFRTLDLDITSDTYLYVYDTDASTLLASNDDYGGVLASRVEWVAPVDGTYYIMVQHWNPNLGGCGTSYSFMIGDSQLLYLPLVTND